MLIKPLVTSYQHVFIVWGILGNFFENFHIDSKEYDDNSKWPEQFDGVNDDTFTIFGPRITVCVLPCYAATFVSLVGASEMDAIFVDVW